MANNYGPLISDNTHQLPLTVLLTDNETCRGRLKSVDIKCPQTFCGHVYRNVEILIFPPKQIQGFVCSNCGYHFPLPLELSKVE